MLKANPDRINDLNPQSDPKSLDTQVDKPIGETSDVGTKAENVGSTVEDEEIEATDLNEL